MSEPASPVLQVIVTSAVEATAAAEGWLVAVRDDHLEVVAAAGARADDVMGMTVPVAFGTAGFVVASGQPLAVAPRGDDPRFAEGVAAMLGRVPTNVLTVPCSTDDGVLGALELVDKAGGGNFSFDDVEIATLLAGIAGVALSESVVVVPAPLDPIRLGNELRQLAALDPERYAALAQAITALLHLD